MPQWDPDLEIDETLVRELLEAQFPELDASSARLVGQGWDNSVWLVEEEWAFRIPRREIAIPGIERELAVLSRIAPLVPAPVPVPVFVGHPQGRFPWPFFGCRYLPGIEPADAELPDDARVAVGVDLGRFLSVLHEPATLAAVDPGRSLPVDPQGRADMRIRVERARRAVASLERLGSWRAPKRLDAVLEAALRLPPARGRALAHGDLNVRHVLVAKGRLSAVIDWGDVCIGDPSIDLLLAWSFLPPAGREAFLAEYGPVDEERLLRARVLAVFLDAVIAAYARDVGHEHLEREALAGLERTLVDWPR